MHQPQKISTAELCFLGVVFVVFPVLTAVEYQLYEHTGRLPSYADLLERLLYGVLRAIPYGVYYSWIFPLLFAKRYGAFCGWLVVFLVMLNGYTQYVVYGLVMHLWFLPDAITLSARKWYNNTGVLMHFSLVYVVRELIMVSAFGYYRQSVWQQAQLHALSKRQLQVELASLKTQLQPHFFFNTLNNIYALALRGSVQTAPLVAQHADIMRYILHRAKNQRVPLAEEVDFLANYVAVESMRFSEKATIVFDSQGIQNRVGIEPLLLLPFVENTFKHGLNQTLHQGFVQIVLVLIDAELMLETRNSKVNRPASKPPNPGIGLTNAVKQLALLYPDKHDLQIQEDESTYVLRLRLILNAYD